MTRYVIVCCIRNPRRKWFNRIRDLIELVTSQGFEVGLCIVESDSDSEVKIPLISKNQVVVRLGNLRTEYTSRVQRLSLCREVAKKSALSLMKPGDRALVFDPDQGSVKRISLLEVERALKNHDAVFTNWLPVYYDTFAIRYKNSKPTQKIEGKGDRILTRIRRFDHEVLEMGRIPVKHPPLQVESAFGGLGVYSFDAFSSLNYNAQGHVNQCEHVTANLALRDRGLKLVIVPSVIMTGINRHLALALPFMLLQFLTRRRNNWKFSGLNAN